MQIYRKKTVGGMEINQESNSNVLECGKLVLYSNGFTTLQERLIKQNIP